MNARMNHPVVLCSTPGCEIVVGARGYGSKKPRRCCKCAADAIEQHPSRHKPRAWK